MRQLGRIARLQVQRSSLKVDADGVRRYETGPIVSVPALRLTRDGVVGLPDGIVDVHNATHSQSKNRGTNPVSVGFTGHYRLMRDRFGPRVVDGIAGENILVEHEGRVALEELEGGLWIGDAALVEACVSEPCEPFTRWALGVPLAPTDPRIPDNLRFLREGTRGFYLTYEGEPIEVRVGDVICVRSPARAG